MDECLLGLFEYRFYESEIRPQKDTAQKTSQAPRQQKQQHYQQQKLAGSLSSSSTGLVNPVEYAALSAASSYSEPTQNVQGLYCTACKKKFTNDATFTAHQKSEKHKKAVRAAKSSTVLTKPPVKVSNEQDSAIHSALASMKKAQAIKHKDPAVAATVLWNIAQDMARCGDDTATKSALQDALECMQLMDADSNLRGTKGTPSFWSPRALLKTMLDCAMAIARIEMVADKPAAAIRYKSGLCQFLGIEQKVLEKIGHLCDINTLNKQAVQVVESIPRKFAKDEDVDQAICAMKEVAGALVVCAGGRASSSIAWQGLATYFIAHAFAQSKGQYDTAYAVIQNIAGVLKHLGLVHLAHDCTELIIYCHIDQPDSKLHVAAVVTESILSSDILRARALIDAFNLQTNEPWSVYVAEFIERAIDADAHWMHADALCEWHKVKDSADTPDKNVSVFIDEMLRQSLEPYT